MTKEEETIQINKEIRDVLTKHPNFALTAEPFIDPAGATRARPALVYIKDMGKATTLQA